MNKKCHGKNETLSTCKHCKEFGTLRKDKVEWNTVFYSENHTEIFHDLKRLNAGSVARRKFPARPI
uniref:Uncharacterized protein n=1 Tax=Romanomermis culicivorax TaxID=13658 RepID=A0A915KR68_ROMCU